MRYFCSTNLNCIFLTKLLGLDPLCLCKRYSYRTDWKSWDVFVKVRWNKYTKMYAYHLQVIVIVLGFPISFNFPSDLSLKLDLELNWKIYRTEWNKDKLKTAIDRERCLQTQTGTQKKNRETKKEKRDK